MPPQWETIIKRPQRSWEMEELTAEAALFTFPLPWRCDVNLNATHTSTLAAFRACGGLFQEIKRASTNTELNPKVWIDTFPMMGKGFHLIDTHSGLNLSSQPWKANVAFSLLCAMVTDQQKKCSTFFSVLEFKKKQQMFLHSLGQHYGQRISRIIVPQSFTLDCVLFTLSTAQLGFQYYWLIWWISVESNPPPNPFGGKPTWKQRNKRTRLKLLRLGQKK